MIENGLGHASVVENVVMKSRIEILDKSFSEVIKFSDSADHCEEHMQQKYGENGI